MLDALTATSISPGPGGTRSKATSSSDFQIAGGADLQAHPVVLVVDDGGVPLLGAQRTRAQPRGVPLAVRARRSRPPRSRPAVAVPAARRRCRRRRRSGWRADADARRRSPASGHAARPAPGWARSPASDDLRVPGHDVQPGRLARDLRQLAGDAHQMLAPARGPGPRHCSSGSPFCGPVTTTTPAKSPARELARRTVRRSTRWSARGDHDIGVHCAPCAFQARRSVRWPPRRQWRKC